MSKGNVEEEVYFIQHSVGTPSLRERSQGRNVKAGTEAESVEAC